MSSATGASPYCIPCEKKTHWIEVQVRDEFNKPFQGVSGVLIDGACNEYPITLGDSPILVEDICPGEVTLKLDSKSWLIESQGKTRKPNSEGNPTKDFAYEYQGHKDSKPIFFEVTAGDLTELTEDQALPTRHQTGKADTLKLVADKSYVLKVKGFNFITLRVGMFFDGTGNNTYSAQWGKSQLDKYYTKWRNKHAANKHKAVTEWPSDMFKFPEDEKFHFFWEEDFAVDGSAANELTNIQKLHDLYPDDVFDEEKNVFVHPEYITGIGTGNEQDNTKPADESVVPGQAFGTGDYGVIAKVDTGISTLCDNLKQIRQSRVYAAAMADGISKLEFDVFGFSRGAAAARHFTNVIVDGKKGRFATKFTEACKSNSISLKSGFDWSSNKSICIKFVGVFDTVAAIFDPFSGDFTPHNDDNGDVRLWLDPDRIENVVHLTAHKKTEYRYNFCLNKVNPNGKFKEYVVPGAHSDLGGGYQSTIAYDTVGGQTQDRYLLPLLEVKPIKRLRRDVGRWNYDKVKASLDEKFKKVIDHEVSLGWNKDDYIVTYKTVNHGRNDQTYLQGTLQNKRIVEGDLSRLYLRVMFGLAEHAKVPLDDEQGEVWNEEGDSYYSVPKFVGNYDFGEFCKKALSAAKSGELLSELDVSNIEDVKDSSIMVSLMEANLIHHSSDCSIANKPHEDGDAFVREIFECKKES
ncbi:DUF2235 domain-containing protein [Vibrio europaeus]|uniref:DUF2235 domain-containing protein n=1 Tax=Vibrio europaeus TaxID=300876 RepID=A0AAE7DWL4_9VIBR|nr:DUF2235 domain-containing protein [Vibrio europaeus]MDC5806881.1 DUF2235 domain-containing protein [Vibrio europaeus]MDC5809478.1 DUF2235 domain-containing protein [Vibrio europaeus]MDC5827406.1 DUF2235 domain-containing protein [Vibrio europaeus]MDC5830250.1 DUF2235 domain-containing protein [Vibrio europaeus]MDC5837106.1 DUF2235 domain-containing protein [Vibrio europaeus]